MTLFSPDRGVMLVVAGMIVGIVIEITFASRLIIPWMMLGVGLLYIAQNHSSGRRQRVQRILNLIIHTEVNPW